MTSEQNAFERENQAPQNQPQMSADDQRRLTGAAGENTDDELQRELEEAFGGATVFDMMDAEEAASRGSKAARKGKVLAIHGDDIFVDFGGKTQGLLPASHYADDPLPKVGEWIDVVIRSYNEEEGLMLLARPGAAEEADWDSVAKDQVVEGRVTGHNKGGLELNINGIRAFMPISQIELWRVEDDLSSYVNQKVRCRITEVKRSEKNLVVSRRAVLEEEAAEKREQTFQTLTEGSVVHGTVRNIMPYGAFVDIGGVDGLLHVRDMAHKHVADPSEVVKQGQQLELMILKIDRESRRISLGLKQVMPDPWQGAEAKWPVNAVVTGRVSRLADFGAFVEVEEGIEALLPISEITYDRRLRHPSEVLHEGEIIQARVLNLDAPNKRMSLSVKQVGDDPWTGASARWPVNTVVQGAVTRTTDFGAFVELTNGVEGLIHISELTEGRVRSVTDVLKTGDTVKAKVLSVDEDARRIALSVKQLSSMPDYTGDLADQPAAEPAKPQKKRKTPLRGGFD